MTSTRLAGQLLHAVTRVRVRVTRRRVDLRTEPWLAWPTGDVARVGDSWLTEQDARSGGRVSAGADHGLLPTMTLLDEPGVDGGTLRPEVRIDLWRLPVLRLLYRLDPVD